MISMTTAVTITALAMGGWWGEAGNGKIKEEPRSVGEFTGIDVGGGIEADVKIGSERKVTVTADENLLPLIKTQVENGVLKVYGNNVRPTRSIRLTVVTPKLESIEAGGGVKLHAVATATRHLKIEAGGGAELDVSGIDSEEVTIELSGGVKARVAGRAKKANFDLSGGVEIEAQMLQLESATLDASGGVQGHLAVSQSISGETSGGVTLAVKGKPSVNVRASGGASIRTE